MYTVTGIIYFYLIYTCNWFVFYEEGLDRLKNLTKRIFAYKKQYIHCRCQNIVTDKEHSYEIPCPPTCKPSQETTCYQCHNNKTDEEHSYEKPCRPSNDASETNGAESTAYEEIKKKKFEGVDSKKIGEEM